ncbi:MAG: N-methyltryptophan oxidase [Actinomycetota bacterium]|jgi:sarcosine oxidase|nr:MAG: N-methyltryptophan oxidase [Actinomycetota bacterium]
MAERYDAIVVGAGAVGAAAAWALADRGAATLLLERFAIGHGRGSSGGPTRIFRFNYAEAFHVEMARHARDAWWELEARTGEDLLRVTGGLDVGRAARACAETVRAAGLEVRRIDAGEVAERWPALRLPDDAEIYFQPDAGVLRAEHAVRAQARLAAALGAELAEAEAVHAIAPVGGGLEVRTEARTARAPTVVVAAGPWAPGLLARLGIRLALTTTREQVSYVRLDDPAPLPTVIERWDDGVRADYLVPDPWDPGWVKVGLHRGGRPADADAPGEPDAELEARARRHAAARLAPHGPVGSTQACRYTLTPDERFVLDRVGPVVIASACSGHGFKFAPLTGRLVADLVTGAPPAIDLGPFRADRPGLRP